MRRAQTMAQAAWSRPSMDISSWACMGPRRRPINTSSPESSSSNAETQSISTALELPVSSSNAETTWHSEQLQDDDDDGDKVDAYVARHEDRMTEFELWEKLEQELYDRSENEEEADVAKEMREEEEAAIAEGREIPSESKEPEKTKEAHRFFPAGKIMHIVSIPQTAEGENDESSSSSDSENDNDNDNDRVVEDKVGIFLTPRSLYSKIRLSHSMIADHFMPVYRRQIEKLIGELEKEDIQYRKVSLGRSEEIEVVL